MTAVDESTTTTASAKPTRTRSWALVAAGMFAVAWGGNEFTPLLVMYKLDHGFTQVVVDTFLFAYVFGIVPALLIGGPLSDRLGRRALMLPAPFIAVAGSLVLASAPDSAPMLIVGRILSGVALGLGMAVGGSWVKELSSPEYDPKAGPGSGARRAAMSLTAGFGVGAGIAGVLAQWGPWPSAFPYAVHIAIALAAGIAMLRAPETRAAVPKADRGRLAADLKIPSAGHRRFLYVAAPVAPWVFGAAASAYAVLPALMTSRSGGAPIAFSALLCVIGLGSGFAIQAVGRRIDTPLNARAVAVALAVLVAGMSLAAVASSALTVPLAMIAAAVLGCGYGMALVSGLQEIQRIAGPDDLAGLTAVFYSLSYLGFAVPAVMAVIAETNPALTYPMMFVIGAIVAAASLVLVVVKWRADLPAAVAAEASERR
ncbi:MFS transporter [Rhodococcus sp. AG1013]|uniref:MFS transporter n=1 Tax=unclassified Rhodococcus (in: high G+C Gram-positive bacteria) TaxID=192944 RepID=UPI000E0AA699|nr:putative MFS family arabinose efflux permease [Rhodococcus sp. AG1013]